MKIYTYSFIAFTPDTTVHLNGLVGFSSLDTPLNMFEMLRQHITKQGFTSFSISNLTYLGEQLPEPSNAD